MAHYYGDRRHRLNADEVPLVRSLILEKLAEFYEERRNLFQAEELYRVIHRIDHYKVGPPSYPETFTWTYLEAYLTSCYFEQKVDNGPLEEDAPEPGGGWSRLTWSQSRQRQASSVHSKRRGSWQPKQRSSLSHPAKGVV